VVELLSDDVGRVVIDKTGFTDLFSCRLEFAPVALQVCGVTRYLSSFRMGVRAIFEPGSCRTLHKQSASVCILHGVGRAPLGHELPEHSELAHAGSSPACRANSQISTQFE
jgi:hypothetical protein